jgi:lipopolysaccharide export system ATP-binding protein
VDGVSLEVSQGEVVGLLGSNGAGKTTTFTMVVGLVKPTSGKILLDGAPIGHLSMYKRARLGVSYLAQEASVFRYMSVEDNLRLVWQEHRVPAAEQKVRLDRLVEEFALQKVLKSKGIQLSGGERRRVEIARALAIDPRFLLLDEPFTGIDPIQVAEIQEVVSRLKGRGIGVLITDHNVRETLAITDRSYIIRDGKILVAGDARSIASSPIARKFYLGEKFQTGFESPINFLEPSQP